MLLDERVDAVAATSRQTFPARFAIAGGASVLTSLLFGAELGAAWGGAYILGEAWTRHASQKVMRGEQMTRGGRARYLASILLQNLNWSALALIYWSAGDEPYRLAAMAVLAGMLVHAQGFSFRAPQTLALLGAPPAILWLLLPIAFGGYSGLQLVVLSFGLLMLLTYVAASARANMRTASDLAAARREAIDANEAKSAFFAVMSHELRTPLNGVLGMARALQSTALDARQSGYLDTIVRSGDGLLSMLNDMLDVSKIEAGRMDLEIAAFDLKDVGEQAIDLWSEIAAGKGLELNFEVDPQVPALVLGDETRVRQILLNLISNALKFTEQGEVRVTLRAASRTDGDDGVEILVTDTGIGMTQGQLALIFRPFAQADTSTARLYGGSGLGLSICRTLAAMMDGEIGVDSEAGRGTCFRVWLPLPAAPTQAELSGADRPPNALPALRILVADDNPINQAVARAILEAAGAIIETVNDGAEALDRLRVGSFDLVLMDLHMPVMDGLEAVTRLRQGQAGRADIPVIALTGDVLSGQVARLQALGFNGVQQKPVQPSALIAAIAAALTEQEQKADAAAA